jgi:hypothetical protein
MWILINLVLVFETKHADDIIVIHAPSIYETQEECNNELIKAHKNLDGGILQWDKAHNPHQLFLTTAHRGIMWKCVASASYFKKDKN